MIYTALRNDLDVVVKRTDLIHPIISGNKWYKLKYNLESLKEKGLGQLITFGGAWSNHIHAVAYAVREHGVKAIGIIRGEEPKEWSLTLQDAKRWGMQLEFIDREAYNEKDTEDFKMWLMAEYGPSLIIPEGGANYLGVNGCMEMIDDEDAQYDFICCSAGTGTMAAGLALKLKPHQRLVVFPALKGGFLKNEIRTKLYYFLMDDQATDEVMSQVDVIDDYHFGGYAKRDASLIEFMQDFEKLQGIPLDQIYTGKLCYGVIAERQNGLLKGGKRILVIHSGGLQGRRSLSSFEP